MSPPSPISILLKLGVIAGSRLYAQFLAMKLVRQCPLSREVSVCAVFGGDDRSVESSVRSLCLLVPGQPLVKQGRDIGYLTDACTDFSANEHSSGIERFGHASSLVIHHSEARFDLRSFGHGDFANGYPSNARNDGYYAGGHDDTKGSSQHRYRRSLRANRVSTQALADCQHPTVASAKGQQQAHLQPPSPLMQSLPAMCHDGVGLFAHGPGV